MSPEIIEVGNFLRENSLKIYKKKYKDRRYRILFQMPNGGVGLYWFHDLLQTLQYTGIECTWISRNTENFQTEWMDFKPSVFITMDETEVLDYLDLKFILDYKKKYSCLRLYTPISTHRFPKKGLSSNDKRRLKLACSGQSADAFFSMMVPEFFSMFWREWEETGFRYLSLPNACNPFRHYPVDGLKRFDYFNVTSLSIERAKVTYRYLKPIFQRYNGLWAGPGWGFGESSINPESLKDYYAQSCISPAPLLDFLTIYPAETTERSFSAPACGAFLITNKTPVTHRFFDNDEIIAVENEKEFINAFTYYIDRHIERNAIILKSMKRVFNEHTYFHRINSLIDFLDENSDLF